VLSGIGAGGVTLMKMAPRRKCPSWRTTSSGPPSLVEAGIEFTL